MRATKPHDIVDSLRIHFGETVGYKIAQRIRQELLDSDLEAQQYNFQLLPAYMQKLCLQ